MDIEAEQIIEALKADNEALKLDNEQKAQLVQQLQAQMKRQANILLAIHNMLKAFLVEQ